MLSSQDVIGGSWDTRERKWIILFYKLIYVCINIVYTTLFLLYVPFQQPAISKLITGLESK